MEMKQAGAEGRRHYTAVALKHQIALPTKGPPVARTFLDVDCLLELSLS